MGDCNVAVRLEVGVEPVERESRQEPESVVGVDDPIDCAMHVRRDRLVFLSGSYFLVRRVGFVMSSNRTRTGQI